MRTFRSTRGGRRGRDWPKFCSLVAVLMAVAFLAACAPRPASQLYHCPMHPDYVSDRPGDCPICGMRLVPMKATAPTPGASEHQHGAATGQPPAPGAGLPATRDMPAGMAAVHTDEGRADLAGVRTAVAAYDAVVSVVRAVGTVVPDETRIRHITTKVGGYVEKLHAHAVGQPVTAGEPLFEIYSPELLASQEEYLRARQSAEEFAKSTLPEVRRGGADLAAAARRRLELFDVPQDFLQQLETTGQVQRTVVFRAPFSGYVSDKTIVEGHKIDAGMDLMTITDLSHVWVAAQLYEAEAIAAQVGRPAMVTLPYDAGTSLRGRISLVYPTIETESRTIKVRLEFDNPRLLLKPGMFVNVALEASRVSGVVVPDSAIIDSGTRQVVFVEAGPGQFAPREVQVGPRADGKAVIRSGVSAGERVAVSANFLLDSESRLRGAVTGKTPAPAGDHSPHKQ
jgi:membrane fusion protein, copper/silver efflux system